MEEKVLLDKCSFTFTQESHCCSPKEIEFEEIEIEFTADLGIDSMESGFFVLKTQQWAIDDEKDLKVLFDRIKQIIKKK